MQWNKSVRFESFLFQASQLAATYIDFQKVFWYIVPAACHTSQMGWNKEQILSTNFAAF